MSVSTPTHRTIQRGGIPLLVSLLAAVAACSADPTPAQDDADTTAPDATQDTPLPDASGDLDAAADPDAVDATPPDTNQEDDTLPADTVQDPVDDVPLDTADTTPDVLPPTDTTPDTAWDPALPATTGCNRHDALCTRRVDEVVFAATHNSMSARSERFVPPNQNTGLEAQLTDGIRAFLIDTYVYQDSTWLCHFNCLLGKRDLVESFRVFADFLRANPREVVFLLIEDYVSPEQTAAAVEAAGLAEFLYTHPPDSAWPTLGQMVDANTRLVITAQDGSPPPAWYHNLWQVAFDTPYSFRTADEFSCTTNRGNSDNALFLINHWLGAPVADQLLAEEVNTWDVLWTRVQDCYTEHQRLPTFLAVDFHDVGDLFEVVDALNGVGPVREGFGGVAR